MNKSLMTLIVLVSIICVSIFFAKYQEYNSDFVQTQPGVDGISAPQGYYEFKLKNLPDKSIIEHLNSPLSNVKIVRMTSEDKFIGYSNGKNLPNYISSYSNINTDNKFDGEIKDISSKGYLAVDNPASKQRTCFITVRFYENYDFSYLWTTLGLRPIQDRDNEYLFSIEPCDEDILKSKITEIVNRPEVESVRITPDVVTDIYNIGTRTGVYNIQAGITPYNEQYTGQGMKIGFWDAGSVRDHPDFENRIKFKQCGTFSCPLFNQFSGNHPTLIGGVLLGSGVLWNQLTGGNIYPPSLVGVAPDADGYSYDVLDAGSEMLWAYDIYDIAVSSNSWHWAPLFAGGPGIIVGNPGTSAHHRMEYESRSFNHIAHDLFEVPVVFAAGNTICDPSAGGLCQLFHEAGIVCDPENYYPEDGLFEKTLGEQDYPILTSSLVRWFYMSQLNFNFNPNLPYYQEYDVNLLNGEQLNLDVGPYSTVHVRIYEIVNVDQWDCLYPPSSAKNILTVGSIDSTGTISSFSSRGPTWDGRVKPDVVSLGEGITTTNFDSSNQPIYSSDLAGTSFATPTVAAHAVLLKQFLDDLAVQETESYAGYESALIKAAFIHTAADMDLSGPDFISGWGEIKPQDAMQVLSEDTLVTDSFNENNKHEVKMYPISIPSWSQITEPLKITLVWNDYWDFAPTFGVPRDQLRELVNNLELTLCDASGSAVEYPFVLDWRNPGVPATRGFNDRDNVEQVLATPQVIQNYITTQTQGLFACVKFANYYDTPEVNQKFVLIIGEGSSSPYQATCGNGQFEPQYGEQCDRVYHFYNFGGQTCGNFGGPSTITNLLRCNAQCKIDGTLCQSPACGNGKLGLGEMCDNSDPTATNACALGCFGPEEGGAKACKCMCTNDNECSGPGRGVMRCEAGVCQGVGDGELDVNEECDPSSTTTPQQSCAAKFGYTPRGASGWLCDDKGKCRDPNGFGKDQFWCPVSNKVINNPPACQNNAGCPAGNICNNDCVCEANKKSLCLSGGIVKNIHPKIVECDDNNACKDKNEMCSNNCQCVKKPKTVDRTSVPVICGDGIVHGGLSGEQCDPPGSSCFYTDSTGAHSSTCSSNCKCNAGILI